MRLHTRSMIWTLSLWLSAGALSWLGWSAQAARAGQTRLPAWHAGRGAVVPLFTNIVVNSTADGTLAALAGNATCDLREAIAAANTNAAVGQCPAGMAGLDTITFSVTGTLRSQRAS